jgi:hypothetical protein
MMSNETIDALTGARYALEGKVVTMDEDFTVLERGTIFIDGNRIAAVQPTGAEAPSGFSDSPLIRTGGTIYPGLIELHNHLSYNILPLWIVPKLFKHRGLWANHDQKRQLVSQPMKVLGKTPRFVPAIVRYVETKCLVAGVTTSQGLSLFSKPGISKFYRGLVRNVEDTDDDQLPEASTKIPDVKDAADFLEKLKKDDVAGRCRLLHLAEGSDGAHKHFEALQLAPGGEWAITPALAGIHCVPLTAEDYQIMKSHGASLVWSPLSNLLLYGQTADVRAAKESGVDIALGADWSPSGSKNLLCELKVAHLVNEALGRVFTVAELVAMVTSSAARILKWDDALGSLEADKRADLIVVRNRAGDPYERLLNARESSMTLVVIDGVPRCGARGLMAHFGDGFEEVAVGETGRFLNLKEALGNPVVGDLTLREATEQLQEGLLNLEELAKRLDDPGSALAALAGLRQSFEDPDEALDALAGVGFTPEVTAALEAAEPDLFAGPIYFLELDQDELEGESLRPHLAHPITAEMTGVYPPPTADAAKTLTEWLEGVQIDLDPLTVVGDDNYFLRLALQPNLPNYIKAQLPPFYGVKALPDDASFLERLDPVVEPQFAAAVPLSTFVHTAGRLSLNDRKLIVEQALTLLESIYVHLPLKRSMHAIDPIQRLRLLQHRLAHQSEDSMPPEIEFHNEMTSIFTSTRDLHTNYLLPNPFRDKAAILPFMIEEYNRDGQRRYIVSKVASGLEPSTFTEGVEVLYWNGIPIQRAIELNAERQAGSNPAARHAQGLDSLTIRPMIRVLPPDEEWVTIRYRTLDQRELEATFNWLVFSPEAGGGAIDPDAAEVGAAVLGYDLQTDAIHQVKKILYAPKAIKAERDIATARTARAAPPMGMDTTMPTVFRVNRPPVDQGRFGYIRVFTFNVPDADAFVHEFIRLVGELEAEDGLIIDVRGNGGGLIYAAEQLLQVLTPQGVEPERAQFINTPLTLSLCRRHMPSQLWADFDLGQWVPSIDQAVQTGATYSRGFPITDPEWCNVIGQTYHGPVVLITDALCYSACDMFAAGFQDHEVGTILGTSGNTGAGGANVWTHRLLLRLMEEPEEPPVSDTVSPFEPLPHGGGMRAAVRRTLRVRDRAGIPVEDLGVIPDEPYQMTYDDLMHGNRDLIRKACEILADMPSYTLSVRDLSVQGTTISANLTTRSLSRLDVYLSGRPLEALDVVDESRDIVLDLPAPLAAGERVVLDLKGYESGHLAAARRIPLRG